MSRAQRSVEACRYRLPLSAGDESLVARCGLLGLLTGLGGDDPHLPRLRREACEACCRSFPPSVDELNPVVASFLYDLSARIVEQGGIAGCDLPKARDLNRKAVLNLPSEEDCREVPPGREGGAEGSAARSLFDVIPAPARRTRPNVRRWAVGVTTAHRQVPTLAESLVSLANAGWERPRLFADGPVAIPEALADLPRTTRSPLVGAWPNYFLALTELLMREPEADAYLLAQDDVLFAPGFSVRDYLEQILWPAPGPGIVSLFCSRAYTQSRPGWYRFQGVWIWGALAFVFSREAAQQFLADIVVVRHRRSRQRNGLADIDGCIGRWASSHSVSVFYPSPSLVQHIGDVSSLWKGERALGNRRATWFASK